MKRRTAWLASVSVAALLAGSAAAGVPVPLEQVPAPAVKGVKDRFPKADIRSVDKEAKDRFEFTLKEGERTFEVGIMADGKLVNVKEELKAEQLPAVVTQALQKKYPGAKVVEAEKVTTGEGDQAKVTYDLAIQTDKEGRNVTIDAAGKFVGEPE